MSSCVFIFLVSNIGGALTPLGDPPLFLGFLEGVDFFWTARALWQQTLFTVSVLIALFYLIDCYFHYKENPYYYLEDSSETSAPASRHGSGLRIGGAINIALIGVAISAIVASGLWRPGVGFDLFGARIELQNAVRERS